MGTNREIINKNNRVFTRDLGCMHALMCGYITIGYLSKER